MEVKRNGNKVYLEEVYNNSELVITMQYNFHRYYGSKFHLNMQQKYFLKECKISIAILQVKICFA